MRNKIAFYTFILFVLYFGQVLEKAIPHSHIEKSGLIIPDFSGENEDSSSEDDCDSLHTTFYQLSNSAISFDCSIHIQLFIYSCLDYSLINYSVKSDYNILPKVLNSILFIVHTYSSKAPPFIN